jgi:hypothetical protein
VAACHRVVLARFHEVVSSGCHVGGCDYKPWGLLRQRSMGIVVAKCEGDVCKGAKILAPTGIRSPDRPARSVSLYRLSYPGPLNVERRKKIMVKL